MPVNRESGPGALFGDEQAEALIRADDSVPVHDDWKHRLLGDLVDLTPEQIVESSARPQLMQIIVNPLVAYLSAEVAARNYMSRRGWITYLVIEGIAAEHPEIDKELLWRGAPSPRNLKRAVPIGTLGSGGRRRRKRAPQND